MAKRQPTRDEDQLSASVKATDEEDVVVIELCIEIETILENRYVEHQPQFAAILAAVESQVEEDDADPTVVRHLGDAVLALAVVDRVSAPDIRKITQLLGQIHDHVATRASR